MGHRNVLVILTDELRRDSLGCYGNPIAKTPNIDKLAADGIQFDNAYTASPICVPARASIATGLYVHETACWSNAQPYTGTPKSWGHVLKSAGHEVVSVGKLHFRDTADDNGFSQELMPLHVKGGKGWVHGLLRERLDLFDGSGFAKDIGPGEDAYTVYDRAVCDTATDWLREKAADPPEKPWAAFVSFLRPHYPMTCPPEFYNLYDPAQMPASLPATGADHPILAEMRVAMDYDSHFTEETRAIAKASYYGLCSFVDAMLGRLMAVLAETGLDEDTTIIFSSDHGECLGDRGFWTKMVMYEEAAAVPLIVSGAGVLATGPVTAPVSLVDLYPSILEIAGADDGGAGPQHARSLLTSDSALDPDRAILSEYHDWGARTGMFMLRWRQWKLVVYPGFASQLFNLEADPQELRNLIDDPAAAEGLAVCQERLADILDPDAVNARALGDQETRIAELGGRAAILAMQNYDHTPVEG